MWTGRTWTQEHNRLLCLMQTGSTTHLYYSSSDSKFFLVCCDRETHRRSRLISCQGKKRKKKGGRWLGCAKSGRELRIICSFSRIPTLENEAYAVLLHRHGPFCHCCMRNNRCACPEGPGCVIYHPLPQVPCMSCHAASHLKLCPADGEQMKCTGLTFACVQSPCSSLKKNPSCPDLPK